MLILIADDSQDNLRTLQRRLERRDYEVIIAGDGAMAVQMAQDLRPDAILMDIRMPVLSGIDATKAIKADPATEHIAVIAMTEHATDSERNACMRAGCEYVTHVPVDFAQLILQLQAVSLASAGNNAA